MTQIKLGTFAFEAGKAEAGVLVGENKVVKLAEGYAAYAAEKKPALQNLPSDMVEMMKLGKAGVEAARALVEWIPANSPGLLYTSMGIFFIMCHHYFIFIINAPHFTAHSTK